MAPDSNSFVQSDSPSYTQDILSEDSLSQAGLFNPKAVSRLVAKCTKMSDKHLSFKDNMSFISILSTQLLHNRFIQNFEIPNSLDKSEIKTFVDLR